MEEFKPQNEEERQFVEHFNAEAAYLSERVRSYPKSERVPFLRLQIDLIVMNIYLQALKNEDYETCEAAKTVLAERGFKIQ